MALAALIAGQGATWRYAHALLGLWRDILQPLPEGAAVLLIAHSGELESALVAAFPQADHATWGELFAPCEGAAWSSLVNRHALPQLSCCVAKLKILDISLDE